ncbi:MAG TPA: Hsp20/alpha crystallin family protein [Planctomycetota bacterium]
MLDFPRSVEDLFNKFWGGFNRPTVDSWIPPVDLIETPQAYLLRLEIPGVNPDDVEVTLVGDTLTVRGEKRIVEKDADQTWSLTERLAGHFERSFRLPAPASTKEIEAEARHGVLAIRVMKAAEAQPRKIAIRHG